MSGRGRTPARPDCGALNHESTGGPPRFMGGLLSHCPAVGLSPEPATQSQQGGGLSGRVVSGDPACHGNDFEDPREYTPTQAMQGVLLTPKCETYVSVSLFFFFWLSYKACRILDQRSNARPLQPVEAQQTTGLPGSPYLC